MKNGILILFVCLCISNLHVAQARDREAMVPARTSRHIVSQHNTVFTTPPKRTPFRTSVDGPLLGNGDMGVAIGGAPNALRFILCKNDLWRLQHRYGGSGPRPFGHLEISIPALEGASYKVTQDFYTATTKGEFEKDGVAVHINSYVAATENLLVLELAATGQSVDVRTSLSSFRNLKRDNAAGEEKGVLWARRAFVKNADIPSGAAVAWKAVGTEEHSEGGSLVLKPGKPIMLVLAMESPFGSRDYTEQVIKVISNISSKADLSEVRRAHEKWWAQYWDQSYVSINDPIIEKQYYLSLYGMGSCSRDPAFPPPLFGWTTTNGPLWLGDYHLNYNYQAPFYGLARANRLEQADPHDAPLLDFMERAQWHCKEIFGFDGVMYPVGIGPKGIETTYGNPGFIKRGDRYAENGGLFFGQRSNGAYALVNVASRWYCTYDHNYGKKIYPLVEQVATFWENYVTWEPAKKRFIIDKDSIHEGSGKDLNSCLSIGLVRNTLLLAIDLSKELQVDTDRQKKWQRILDNLAGYTFQEKDGKQVFRYTEKSTAWWKNNTLGIQQIYPAGQIHLDSDSKLLEVSRNTIKVMQRWHDNNGSNSFFPAAVRVGYDEDTILRELRAYSKHTRPNGFQEDNGHAIENLSTVPNTINEMLCMGHNGILRLFPVWPKGKNAFFQKIRCWGAFLVSSELKDGKVQYVTITSEKGRDCTVVNPWPGKKVQVLRNGKKAETLKGERFTFKTKTGERIVLSQK